GLRYKGERNKPGKSAGLILEFTQLPDVIDSLFDRFDMSKYHCAGTAPSHFVPDPVHLFPFFGGFLAAADSIADHRIENFRTASRQGIEPGVTHCLKRCLQRELKDALGNMPDFNGCKRFDVEAWIEVAKLSQHFEIPLARQRRMKSPHHMHFCNSTGERAARSLNNLWDCNFEGMRIALSRSKGTELAGQNANVRIID